MFHMIACQNTSLLIVPACLGLLQAIVISEFLKISHMNLYPGPLSRKRFYIKHSISLIDFAF